MNKLVLDTEILEVEDLELELISKKNKLKLICKGNNKIVLNEIDDFDLEIELLDNSCLDFYSFNEKRVGINNILIIQNNDTEINYVNSFSGYSDSKTIIKNVVVGSNNKSNIKLRCVSYSGKITIGVLADIKGNTKDNDLIEDIKGINENGVIEIEPNMEINTSEVTANHYVTISKVSEDDLFYLECKGLSRDFAKTLVLAGFLNQMMEVNSDE